MGKAKILSVFVMVLIITLCGCQNKDSQIQELLNLGEKYLTELDYENAILTFDKVIETEPKAVEAYAGKAKAYAGQQDYEMAKETLQEGIVILDGLNEGEKTEELIALESGMMEELSGYLIRVIEMLTEAGDYDKAVEYAEELLTYKSDEYGYLLALSEKYRENGELDKALELLNELRSRYPMDDVQSEIEILETQQQIELEYMSDLDTLQQMIAAGDIVMDGSILQDDEFLSVIGNLSEPIIIDKGEGTYIGFYPNGFTYIGDMIDHKRQGYGVWYKYYQDTGFSSLFEGIWKDDYPNGSGKLSYYDPNATGNYSYLTIQQGEYKDGYEEGTRIMTMNTYANGVSSYYYTCSRGIPTVLNVDQDGRRLIALREDTQEITLSWSGNAFAVPGARIE